MSPMALADFGLKATVGGRPETPIWLDECDGDLARSTSNSLFRVQGYMIAEHRDKLCVGFDAKKNLYAAKEAPPG